MLHVSGASIAGYNGQTPMSVGIAVRNDSLMADTVHVEYCSFGIDLGGVGNSALRGITGSFNAVGELVTLQSTFHGSLVMQAVNPNGATAAYHDYGAGTIITTRIPHLVVQK
jgi:hypothetical protein